MLSLSRVNTFYGETQVLFDLSLDVRPGEVVALLGPNGAGKTTTLRSVLGLTAPRSGSIRFVNKPIERLATHEIARLGVGWVPDDRRVFPALKVRTNLALGAKKSRFRAWTAKDCFELFSALEYLMDRECENLSGGEMQMVSISRALMGAPGLVLFDEPSQGLAPKLTQDVFKAIRKLRGEGVSSLVVEQNAVAVLDIADRVYVLDKGRIAYSGAADELRADAALRHSLLGA